MPILVTKSLQTTPAMCAKALESFTPMEQSMFFEAWAVQDAAASHELLALVRRLGQFIELRPDRDHQTDDLLLDVAEWVQP